MRFESFFRRVREAVLLALGVAFFSCGNTRVVHPSFPDGGLLKDAAPFSAELLSKLNGMYFVADGGPLAGVVAVHAAPAAGTLSIFARSNDAYAILRAGCLDGGERVVFEGAWRHPRTTEAGLVRLFVEDAAIAKALCTDTPLAAAWTMFTLSGATGSGNALPGAPLSLAYDHALLDANDSFVVAAHHGACRTIDDCGASENSLESIELVESFGASVVELDVRITKDGVPILYHDENFTPRLSNGTYCHGPVSEFTLAGIRALCTLTYGEKVPTLEDALGAALNKTTLHGVWLDIKTPEAVGPAIKLAETYNHYGKKQQGRVFRAVIGLAETEVLEAYIAAEKSPDSPCLVELEPADVRRAKCQLWGPRWTRGPLQEEAAALQSEGRGVVYWTIDEPTFIELFLKTGKPNGILSDRPGLVFQEFQVLGVLPAGSVKL